MQVEGLMSEPPITHGGAQQDNGLPSNLTKALQDLAPHNSRAVQRLITGLRQGGTTEGLKAVPHKAQAAVCAIIFEAPSLTAEIFSSSNAEFNSTLFQGLDGGQNGDGASRRELHVLLTTRALHLNSHPGQASLPGGKMDALETPAETALRESEEEVYLPTDDEGLVRLGLGKPFISKSTLLVHPYFVLLSPFSTSRILSQLRPSPDEVSRIWSHPLRALLSSEAPPGLKLRNPSTVDRHRPAQECYRSFSDVDWFGGKYRLHRFRSAQEHLKGLTCDILLYAVSLLYASPSFNVHAPQQRTFDSLVEEIVQRHKRRQGRASQRWGDGESGDKQGTSEAFGTVQGRDWVAVAKDEGRDWVAIAKDEVRESLAGLGNGLHSREGRDERGETREDPDWVTRRRRTLVNA
ncbi:Peroxisomal NUDIX hydrolase [Ceraceosorus bombacis]|uniref:Peroxisomal NUDIX hydrolase n=1 Tax=Ceraceosorus bombacis TaxID=401625 RepID=A0A0N7LAV5_9BASI|nr:Peroxisomal NUDIX hydrolase [Ceraceosorus bombacis]